MRRFCLSAALLTVVISQSACDLSQLAGATQAQIESKAHQAMLPYFPKAKVTFSPADENLITITCAGNVGDQLLADIAPRVMEMPEVKKLQAIRRSPWLIGGLTLAGARLPRYFSLGFDRSLLVLDTVTGQHFIKTDLPREYLEGYSRECNTTQLASNVLPRQSGFVWIGVFKVTATKEDGTEMETTGRDSLGVYASDQEFEDSRIAEVMARRELIKRQFAARQLTVTRIDLIQVTKISF